MGAHSGNRPGTKEWSLIYQFTNFRDIAAFSYDVNNSLSATPFSRILYQMKYDQYSVWCELDDFSSGDATKIGLPTNFVWEVNTTNMYVWVNNPSTGFPGANQSTIYNRGPVNARINFWPSDYGTQNATYDHDDDGYNTSNGYGSMQIFDVSAATPECIFAWNAWGLTNGGDCGIGNRNTSHPDWTFAYNANTIQSKLCRIWVK